MGNEAKPEPEPALIMFFAANPLSTNHIAIDREAKEIEKKLELKSCTVPLRFKAKWAIQPDDLLEALNQDRPIVVHFSGHGSRANGLIMHGKDNGHMFVTTSILRRLFRVMKDDIRIVVLNACYAEEQARAISETIDCVVGMREAIGDEAASLFAMAFYRALGHGRDVQNAFEQGLLAIESAGLDEARIPMLIARAGIEPSTVFLRDPGCSAAPSILSTPCAVQGASTKVVVVFQATMREFDAQVIARVTTELQRLTGDLTVRVLQVEEGSVRLIFEMTAGAAQKLLQMQHDGNLDAVSGFRVLDVLEDTHTNDEHDTDGQPASPQKDGRYPEIVTRPKAQPEPASTSAVETRMPRRGTKRELGLDNPAALASLPIYPLPNCVLLPGGLLPLLVFEPRYRELTRDCLAGHQLMGIARLRPGFESSYYGRPPVYENCGVGRILVSEELPDGRFRLLLRGVARVEIVRELPADRLYRLVEARELDDATYDPVDAHDHLHRLIELCDRLAEVIPKGGSELRDLVRTFDAPGACADAVTAALVMDADARQELLEARDPMVRLQRTLGHVAHLLLELRPDTEAVS